MELRDYIRMFRRGWPAIVLITALFVGLAGLYTTFAPKRYESNTTLFISASDLRSTDDLQQGNSFARDAVGTYAKIVGSEAVLAPVGATMNPPRSTDFLTGALTVDAPDDTTLITITAAGDTATDAAALADAVAGSAIRVIPTLQYTDVGRPLVRVQQLRPATQPVDPVSPNTKHTIALGLIVGLCVGLALTIAVQTLDTRIRRSDDLRELTDISLLAVVPHRTRAQRHGLAVRDDPTGVAGEAFRTLRTNLGFMESMPRRSLLVTSVHDGRDGAQVPANLAWSFAQAGWRVLLVDLDLRHTTVGEELGFPAGPGLADVLLGNARLLDVIRSTSEPRLRVVLSGTPQASPSDLLTGPLMNNVLQRMEQEYDYVFLHAPAVIAHTDAALMSRAAGSTLVTVAAGRTRGHELTTALSALANVRVKPLGLVLTGTRRLDGLTGLVRSGLRQHPQPAPRQVAAQNGVPTQATPPTVVPAQPVAVQAVPPSSVVPKPAAPKPVGPGSAAPKPAAPKPTQNALPSMAPGLSPTLRMYAPQHGSGRRPAGASSAPPAPARLSGPPERSPAMPPPPPSGRPMPSMGPRRDDPPRTNGAAAPSPSPSARLTDPPIAPPAARSLVEATETSEPEGDKPQIGISPEFTATPPVERAEEPDVEVTSEVMSPAEEIAADELTAAEPDVAEWDAGESDADEPDTVDADADEMDADEPDIDESNANQWDAAELDVAEPDATRYDVDERTAGEVGDEVVDETPAEQSVDPEPAAGTTPAAIPPPAPPFHEEEAGVHAHLRDEDVAPRPWSTAR